MIKAVLLSASYEEGKIAFQHTAQCQQLTLDLKYSVISIRYTSLGLVAAILFLLFQAVYAVSLNQSDMHLIFKDAEHSVYLSPRWIDDAGGVTVLLDYRVLANHSEFEGNEPYYSSETRYVIDCENNSIAFKSDDKYQGHNASGKQLNVRTSTVGPDHNAVELHEFMDMNKETRSIFKNACQR
jgi:hypothetical protein